MTENTTGVSVATDGEVTCPICAGLVTGKLPHPCECGTQLLAEPQDRNFAPHIRVLRMQELID